MANKYETGRQSFAAIADKVRSKGDQVYTEIIKPRTLVLPPLPTGHEIAEEVMGGLLPRHEDFGKRSFIALQHALPRFRPVGESMLTVRDKDGVGTRGFIISKNGIAIVANPQKSKPAWDQEGAIEYGGKHIPISQTRLLSRLYPGGRSLLDEAVILHVPQLAGAPAIPLALQEAFNPLVANGATPGSGVFTVSTLRDKNDHFLSAGRVTGYGCMNTWIEHTAQSFADRDVNLTVMASGSPLLNWNGQAVGMILGKVTDMCLDNDPTHNTAINLRAFEKYIPIDSVQ